MPEDNMKLLHIFCHLIGPYNPVLAPLIGRVLKRSYSEVFPNPDARDSFLKPQWLNLKCKPCALLVRYISSPTFLLKLFSTEENWLVCDLCVCRDRSREAIEKLPDFIWRFFFIFVLLFSPDSQPHCQED